MAHTALRKAQKAAKMPAPVKAWAGVVEDKLHRCSPGNGNYYEIYASRAVAKNFYERVVRVMIAPLSE